MEKILILPVRPVNLKNGNGKMTYADGRIDEGNWKDGEFVGK